MMITHFKKETLIYISVFDSLTACTLKDSLFSEWDRGLDARGTTEAAHICAFQARTPMAVIVLMVYIYWKMSK